MRNYRQTKDKFTNNYFQFMKFKCSNKLSDRFSYFVKNTFNIDNQFDELKIIN